MSVYKYFNLCCHVFSQSDNAIHWAFSGHIQTKKEILRFGDLKWQSPKRSKDTVVSEVKFKGH